MHYAHTLRPTPGTGLYHKTGFDFSSHLTLMTIEMHQLLHVKLPVKHTHMDQVCDKRALLQNSLNCCFIIRVSSRSVNSLEMGKPNPSPKLVTTPPVHGVRSLHLFPIYPISVCLYLSVLLSYCCAVCYNLS